jgi:thiaminase/transcriptional activator TenA
MHNFEQSRLAVGAGELWELATRAKFLDAVGDGTLPDDVFQRWLAQDYLFVRGFTDFVALVTARTPRPGQSLVISGLAALSQELDWFESHAQQRGLDLNIEPHPVCRRYVDFLIASAYRRPHPVLLSILYGVEVAYTVGWGRFKAEGPYAEFIDRWTNAAFQDYVAELMNLADRHAHPDQQAAFDEVMRHEHDFWRMTWGG